RPSSVTPSDTHTAPPALYTLSLHDALPICRRSGPPVDRPVEGDRPRAEGCGARGRVDHRRPPGAQLPAQRFEPSRGGGSRGSTADRKSTRLNSSHVKISYAVFCLKKKKKVE